RSRRWVPLAIAAGLLLAVTAGSFWFFTRQPDGTAGFAKHTTGGKNRGTGPASGNWADVLPPDQAPLPSTPTPLRDNSVARADGPRPAIPGGPEPIDISPRAVNRDPVLTAPPV